MGKRTSGPEHIEEAQACLADMDQARRDGAWPKVAALADAAHAHMDMARLAWTLQQAPATAAGGRQGQRWLDAAGVDPSR
jgi:hypothetical protein